MEYGFIFTFYGQQVGGTHPTAMLSCCYFFIKRRKDASLRTLIDNWYVTRTKGHGGDLFRDQFREIKRYFPPGNVYLCGKYRLHVRYVGKNPYVNCGGVTNNFQI